MHDEKILFESNRAMFRDEPLVFALVLALCLVGVGIPVFFIWRLNCRAAKLTVTTEKTTVKKGLLSKHTSEVYHSDVRNIQVHQAPLERVFNTGTISVLSAGHGGVEIDFPGLHEPNKVREIIDAQRRQQRQPVAA